MPRTANEENLFSVIVIKLIISAKGYCCCQ